MRLEPLYRITFTTPEAWQVGVEGANGTERQSFLIAEGRSQGRLSARYRGANFPRTRTDGALLPDFRGVLETDDGATVLFAWHGYAVPRPGSKLELVGNMTHITDDERYQRLNDVVCTLAGEVRPRTGGNGYEVVLDVAELVWEPLE
jgi:Protein of unknown function (DUF3237)